jgi:hypothetical protein
MSPSRSRPRERYASRLSGTPSAEAQSTQPPRIARGDRVLYCTDGASALARRGVNKCAARLTRLLATTRRRHQSRCARLSPSRDLIRERRPARRAKSTGRRPAPVAPGSSLCTYRRTSPNNGIRALKLLGAHECFGDVASVRCWAARRSGNLRFAGTTVRVGTLPINGKQAPVIWSPARGGDQALAHERFLRERSSAGRCRFDPACSCLRPTGGVRFDRNNATSGAVR